MLIVNWGRMVVRVVLATLYVCVTVLILLGLPRVCSDLMMFAATRARVYWAVRLCLMVMARRLFLTVMWVLFVYALMSEGMAV